MAVYEWDDYLDLSDQRDWPRGIGPAVREVRSGSFILDVNHGAIPDGRANAPFSRDLTQRSRAASGQVGN